MPEMKMTRWGIGPRIFVPTLLLSLATWFAASRAPAVFLLPVPDALRIIGGVFACLGVLLWASGAVTVMCAFNRGELVTGGVFALVRHPVYAGWLSLAIPGLALYTGAWPLLVIDVMACMIFRSLIHREDEYLERRFGKPYAEYRARVNALLPIPRFRK